MPTMALRETFDHCSRFTEPWSATGAKCCKAAAGTASVSPGRSSARSRRDVRCCVQNCDFLTESCRPSQCCEPPGEERGAGHRRCSEAKTARHVLWEPGAGDRPR